MSTGSTYPSFLFDPLRHWLDQLPPRPDSAALVALAAQHPRQVASGQRIRFVPPQDDGKAYECRIWERGEVETRPDNWHDFFNSLVWLSFPHTKNAISAAHVVDALQGAARAHHGHNRENDVNRWLSGR